MGQTMEDKNKQGQGYPITGNADLVNADQIKAYLDTLFKYIDWTAEDIMAFRPQGEKGTIQEGKNRNSFIQPAFQDPATYAIKNAAVWAQHHFAGFIIPAIMSKADGCASSVQVFTSIMVDLDTGDTSAKLSHAVEHIGPASMVIYSGGKTEGGHKKIHAYWILSESTEETERCAELRKSLAEKIGGDTMLGRAHQPIRIPGTAYMKNGAAERCELLGIIDDDYHLSDLAEQIEAMPQMPGVEPPAQQTQTDFHYTPSSVPNALVSGVGEGGGDGENRWSQFSVVAGHFIYCARKGMMTVEDAYERTYGWVMSNMSPPWPQERVQSEFRGLLNADASHHGAMPAYAPDGITPPTQTEQTDDFDPLAGEIIENAPVAPVEQKPENPLIPWATHRWAGEDAPQREWLVPGFIAKGKSHLLVATGGAGKSFLVLDLAAKIAAGIGTWMGQPINPKQVGTVVLLTAEDDMDEVHIRLCDIDPEGTRFSSGDKLIVLPLVNAGGAFPLVGRTREATGPTVQWQTMLNALKDIPDLRCVIIDTLNATMHGEENNATVIQEYFREAGKICGEMGAALVVTHHIRKSEHPITTQDEMAAAIRGSSALPAAVRMVIGIWEATSNDMKRRMKALGRTPQKKTLYLAGICKANNPEAFTGVKTLLRNHVGLLEDVTSRDKFSEKGIYGPETQAWLAFSVKRAAEDGHPFRHTGAKGLFTRKDELPEYLASMQKKELSALGHICLENDLITRAKYGPKGHYVLDVPTGPISKMIAEDEQSGSWDIPNWGIYAYHPINGIC